MANVTIVGAGMMGSAMAWPLSDNGHHVRLVGTHLDTDIISLCLAKRFHPRLRRRLPDNVQPYYVDQLDRALEDVEVIVSGVSSPGVRWIGRALAPHLRPGMKIIAVTKGLEAAADGRLRILPDVLADELPAVVRGHVALAAIGGPCIAGELAGRRHTCVYFTSRDAAVLPPLRRMFKTPYYHIFLSTDIVSVEVCVALKNAYTLAVGLADGMLERLGGPDEAQANNYNPAAALFGASAREMARLVSLLGGNPAMVASLPGVGDQYVTCMGGRTVRLGRLLGKGLTYEQARAEMPGQTLESAFVLAQIAQALPGLEARGLLGSDELPLTRCLCRAITGNAPPELDFDLLFPDDLNCT
jgi:glycerol-3-phosphate dehydrogenase (NAD(P)+)